MTLLQRYADRVCRLEYGGIPPVAVANAKNAILDTLAATLSGASEPVSRKLLAYQTKEETAGSATVVGSSRRARHPA